VTSIGHFPRALQLRYRGLNIYSGLNSSSAEMTTQVISRGLYYCQQKFLESEKKLQEEYQQEMPSSAVSPEARVLAEQGQQRVLEGMESMKISWYMCHLLPP